MTASEPLALAGEFPPTNRGEWRRGVNRVLANGDKELDLAELDRRFEQRLVTATYNDISTQPLYTAADTPAAATRNGEPGFAPFVRGATPQGGVQYGWAICQSVALDPDDRPATNRRSLEELERGSSSLLLRPLPGASPVEVAALDEMLDGVYLDLVGLVVDDPDAGAGLARSLVSLWEQRGTNPADVRGGLGLDPIGRRASSETVDVHRSLDDAMALAIVCHDRYPHVRPLVVDATRYHEAGGSDVDELGCAIASGVAYLRRLAAEGVPVERALTMIEFRLAATADQFLTIAKFRAGRRLWSRVAGHLGVPGTAGAQRQHAVMSRAMVTRYDPWVNLLRGTVACMAAGVAGADAITIEPYDLLAGSGLTSDLGRRMARNTQAILIDESHLARVLDPAGGSYYVESLTDAVARSGWAWFQEIEAAGGMIDATVSGMIAERIGTTWLEREKNLARRIDAITGVSEFPNIAETVPAATIRGDGESDGPTALARRRYAAGFESLRERCDEHTRRAGHRPTVLLANLGTAADFTARSTFAKNFFEAGGLLTAGWEPAGEDLGQCLGLLDGPIPVLACLCSTDDRYAADAAETIAVLRGHGIDTVYLAGRYDPAATNPGAAVDGHVAAGSDVLAILAAVLEQVGVA